LQKVCQHEVRDIIYNGGSIAKVSIVISTPDILSMASFNKNTRRRTLHSVFSKILSNAQKATEALIKDLLEKGKQSEIKDAYVISIAFTESCLDTGECILTLEITDEGLGITHTRLAEIRKGGAIVPDERYMQLGIETNGEGLDILQRLMKELSGSFEVTSPGLHKGTTVRLSMPVIKVLK